MRHQPAIEDEAPCCPQASSRAAVGDDRKSWRPRAPIGSFYVICATDDTTVAGTGAEFEDWLARTFDDALVLDRDRSGPHSIEWMRHQCERRSRLEGWLSQDRTTVYLIGDPDLAGETALALRGLLSSNCVVVSGKWFGTVAAPADVGMTAFGR